MSQQKNQTGQTIIKKNQLQKGSSDKQKKSSTNSLSQMVKDNVADAIRSVYKPEEHNNKKNNSKYIKEKYEIGATQSMIPIMDVVNGIIVTSERRYLGVIEVLPIDFNQEKPDSQIRKIAQYQRLFKNDVYKIGIKILNDTPNPKDLIEELENNFQGRPHSNIRKTLTEYERFLYETSNTDAVIKHYYITFEYDPIAGGGEKNAEKIIENMASIRNSIRGILDSCELLYVAPDRDMSERDQAIFENTNTLKYLYYFYNRRTSRAETFSERVNRIQSDFDKFNKKYDREKTYRFEDLVAPKNMAFLNRDSIFMDGIYYGYVGILGDNWPMMVEAGTWIDNYFAGLASAIDVDIICKRLPHNATKYSLKTMNKFTKSTVYEKRQKGDVEAYEKAMSKLNQNQILEKALNAGDEMYDAAIILTIKSSTKKNLHEMQKEVKKVLKDLDIESEIAFLDVEDYFQMTSPFMYFTAPYSRLKHEILASDLASTFCYTAFEVNDDNGFIIGKSQNGTVVKLNNFNNKRYSNGNMVVVGKSGGGKTFTLQLLAERMCLSGYRCFLILPKKADEYKLCCRSLDGEYIRLTPGSKDCVNIFQINPEATIDASKLADNIVISKESPMKKKIKSITSWLSLHLDQGLTAKENNVLDGIIQSVYIDKGITEDIKSIYKEDGSGTLKDMPVIKDLYDKIVEYNEEEYKKEPDRRRLINEDLLDALQVYINGSYSQLNGQTNINLSNRFIVFDINEDDIGEKMIAPMVYLAFDITYGAVRENKLSRDSIIMDEVWSVLQRKDCAGQIENAVRLVRGYSGATVIATQEIKDFLRDEEGVGRAILNNSEINLILGLKQEAADLIQKTLKISDKDKEEILQFKVGNGMFLLGGKDKIKIKIQASEREALLFRTDSDAHRIRAEMGIDKEFV